MLATAASINALGIAVGKTAASQVNPNRQITYVSSDGAGPGNAFGRAANPVKVPVLNPAPGTPVAASTTAKKAKVSWPAPSASNGASAPKDYYIYYQLKGSTTWKKFTDPVTATRSATVTGLTEWQALPLPGSSGELGGWRHDERQLGLRQGEVRPGAPEG